jgi:pyruvate,water dikinase
MQEKKYILWIKDIRKKDVPIFGGKNASMGEMYSQLTDKGVKIPNAFALTADAFRYYLDHNGITEYVKKVFVNFDAKDIVKLQKEGKIIRDKILNGRFPEDLEKEILENYKLLSEEYKQSNADVAVRSSATAEDLPDASFAGQHETFLNVKGRSQLLSSVKSCFASLFNDRAIAYREEKKFDQLAVALSVLVQKMVRSDKGCSGVMFTLDTETGLKNIVLISGIYGIGEMIVKGLITPDTFHVFKPGLKDGKQAIILKNIGRKDRKYIYNSNGGLKEQKVGAKDWQKYCINDDQIIQLAKWAVIIEEHYQCPQDLEWALDGITNELFIVQSRPETVQTNTDVKVYKEYKLKEQGEVLVQGIAVGGKIGQGTIHAIYDVKDISKFKQGEVLVTKMTDPDWVPVMRIASAIITDEGGTTSHAAIVSRELGVPCIVGTKDGSTILKNVKQVTVDCSGTKVGKVYKGIIQFEVKEYNLGDVPELPIKINLNIGDPESAYKYWSLPVNGVGLARQEFIIAEKIKAHPLALYHYDKIKDKSVKKKIDELTIGYKDKKEYYVNELAEGISQIAAAFYPKEVIVRLSDFKTNEYETLLGGKEFEPKEENPMIGWRGASRYYDPIYKPAFDMECQAFKRAIDIYGLDNISILIPFTRTPEEGKKVIDLMAQNGLVRGSNLKVYIMCEIPSNVLQAEEFLEICDGFSIGSNDLTQCALGLDRDNAHIAHISNEYNPAVFKLIKTAVSKCNEMGKYSGICGDAPSTIPGYIEFLMETGIKSMSLTPDAVIKTLLKFSKK